MYTDRHTIQSEHSDVQGGCVFIIAEHEMLIVVHAYKFIEVSPTPSGGSRKFICGGEFDLCVGQ